MIHTTCLPRRRSSYDLVSHLRLGSPPSLAVRRTGGSELVPATKCFYLLPVFKGQLDPSMEEIIGRIQARIAAGKTARFFWERGPKGVAWHDFGEPAESEANHIWMSEAALICGY